MLPRPRFEAQILAALERQRVVALLGPRQCGKSTLAKVLLGDRISSYFDLESPEDQARLENPMIALAGLEGIVALDEIQLRPELLPILRVLADRDPLPARFLILGSASPELVSGSSESLAGRVEFVDMGGFDLAEVGEKADGLWIRGGFPRSFLAATEADSVAWREGFVRTFLERDLPQLGLRLPAPTLRRFWTMLAHYHGQTWNGSEIARSFGISDKTVRGYLDILTGTYMVRQLAPWHENLSKRQVKAPKIYLRDSGLLHTLLGLENRDEVLGHPKSGASWEGFALEQILRSEGERNTYFWSAHGGAEVDLLILRGKERVGYEVKLADAPRRTRSMTTAIEDLQLDHLYVVHPGRYGYPLAEKITALPISSFGNNLEISESSSEISR
jgi:predicted AAA+ superfamily ATPase